MDKSYMNKNPFVAPNQGAQVSNDSNVVNSTHNQKAPQNSHNPAHNLAHQKYVNFYKKTMAYMSRHPKFANDIKNGIIKQQQGRSRQQSRSVGKTKPTVQTNKPNNSIDKSHAKSLYLKNAFVFLRNKDKKPFLSVVIAKRRDGKNPGVSPKSYYGMGYVSNYRGKTRKGTYTFHNQAMSMYSMNQILSASGRRPMNTAQFTKAAGAKTKNGYKAPLFTSRDNIAFKANIRPDLGKYAQQGVNGHHNYIIDTHTISKGEPFNYSKYERPLEHQSYQDMEKHFAQKQDQQQTQTSDQKSSNKIKNPFKSKDDGLGL